MSDVSSVQKTVSSAQKNRAVLADLVDRLEAHDGFARLMATVRPGTVATLDAVCGSARALVAASLAARLPGPLVIVFPDLDPRDDFPDELALFCGARCAVFPAWEADPGERVAHDEIFGDRIRVLKSLDGAPGLRGGAAAVRSLLADAEADADGGCAVQPAPDVVVTSIQSLMQAVPSRAQLGAMTRRLQVGDQVEPEALFRWLVERGLHRTSAVELPGEFAARGGIIDIFAADWFGPARIELFGDQIESIRQFDVGSQLSSAELQAVDITVLETERKTHHQLADHLPPDACFLLIEPGQLEEEARHYLERTERPDEHFSHAAVMRRVAECTVVTAEMVSAAGAGVTWSLPVETVERFSGDMAKVRDELDTCGGEDEVTIVCLTEAEAQRVGEIMVATQTARTGRLRLVVGRLGGGFRMPADGAVVISGSELFQRQEVFRPTRRHLGRAIDSFMDLRTGDLVVHLAHGIARFRGMQLLERENLVEEHLALEFHGGTRIYVPASKIGIVQKYVGGTKSRPRLAKIGGQSWVRQKQAAAQSATDLAAEMIEMQAARQARPGIRFPQDSHWQQEFDAAFPYHETPDQLAAIDAIKRDMCAARPMDRLLCGDVGFGKTEMAIRAAFKAVDSGYQVAVLVPTTILAEQHLRTFANRMAEFPVEIAVLSRFSTRKEQGQTIERLAAGQVDIVIGTHRLAQADVRFENLGLIIIDEEQRFGVEIKERLKRMRHTVDVLTMTATPIPRTLHLSLVGARDICNLETPPEDRIAVETRVVRFDAELIRHAIMRELNRNGQVFFVHNRVHDIHDVAARLAEIVPEARIEIGHGQMPEGQLEDVMLGFVAHRFDVLLATTIVESGLDIPNANTIFIDDADRYGLADLHQLRGRVGRYKHRAYSYLLVDPKKHLSPTAAKRLRAIEEFSNMGAGFALAMRDLEIRGAGNILGTQQSGHIAAVGYEFYCQLLEDAVRQRRKQPPRTLLDVDIDLPGEAHLPDDYVGDMKPKLDLYRRLARVSSDAELSGIRREMEDRFGEPPDACQRMLALAGLRLDAAIWGIQSVHLEDQYVVFGYTDPARIGQLARSSGKRLRVVDEHSAYLPLDKRFKLPDQIIDEIKSVLRSS